MASATSNAHPATTGRRLALVIGVNETCSLLLSPLNHAIADAAAMAEVLQQCGFALFMPPLLREQATSDAIRKAVLRFARNRADDDFLLFYFSGHGQPMTIEAGRHAVYLGSSDFHEPDVADDENSHLALHWLRERLYEGTQAGRVLFILDCCFSGEMGRTTPDHYLQELRQRIDYYFEAPGSESRARSGGLRLALTATAHNRPAAEGSEHGLMTGLLLPALRGEIDAVLEAEQQGEISLQRLHRYLELVMPIEQPPSLSGDFAGRSCILASYPERAAQLRRKHLRPPGAERPTTYIPFPRNPLFQPRPGEFERLETLLFRPGTQHTPARIGLVGVIGMGGVGKTQVAVELAYRCLDRQRFPAGIFWMPATGKTLFDWQRQFATLAFNTGYLPVDDDVSHSENEARRARHFCRYLTQHVDALLILDNVEEPTLVTSVLPELAGGEAACPILYTSRSTLAPAGATTHIVERLQEDVALRLLLEDVRPQPLAQIEAGQEDAEAAAARTVCQRVGYLPLALVQLRSWLVQDRRVTLVRLLEVLSQRGVLTLIETLFATFQLSWERIHEERARHLFKLAASFPEARPIPLWLLGLAAGVGERGDIFEPLGQACVQLQAASLLEELSDDQVRLHPLVREFGRQLIAADGEEGTALLEEAGKRLQVACLDLNWLEQRAQWEGYWECLDQVRAMHDYAVLLGAANQAAQIGQIERWLDRESYLLADHRWWPNVLPGLFYQQLYNRAVEAGQPLPPGDAPAHWFRQTRPAGVEDQALLRIFAGHTDLVESVAFSPDGQLVLTGSHDGTARLWETSSGRELARLEGHTDAVKSVAFSPDGQLVLTCDARGGVYSWHVQVQELTRLLGIYIAAYEVDALHWQDATHVVLADYGGRPRGYPHVYYLTLEGMAERETEV